MRVESIIETAQRAAEAIRAEAREQAARYVESAEREADRVTLRRVVMLADLRESLVERIDLVTQQTDEVIEALDDAMRALAATVNPAWRHEPDAGPAAPASRSDPPPGTPDPPTHDRSFHFED